MEKSERMGMTLAGFLHGQTGREVTLRLALDRIRARERDAAERRSRAARRRY